MKDTASSSESDIKNTQAGSQTGGAQAGAGSTAQQAGTQTGQAQSGAGAAAQGSLAQEETVADIGQAEAYITNMKRLVAGELTVDAHLQQILLSSAQRLARNAEDHDAALRQFALNAVALGQTALQNAVALANRVNNSSIDLDTRIKQDGVSSDGRRADNAETFDKAMDAHTVSEKERTVRGGDAGDVIRWATLAENPIFQDAIAAAVAKAVQKAKEQA